MSRPNDVEEVLPKFGMVFNTLRLHPVLCKPKLLPLKSVTLEKLEKMQEEAQEKIWEAEKLTPSLQEEESGNEEPKQIESMQFNDDGNNMQGDNDDIIEETVDS